MCLHLSILALISWVIGIMFQMLFPMCTSWKVVSMFSSNSFKVLCLKLRSLIHFESIFVQVWYRDLVSVFYIQITSFPKHICWKWHFFQKTWVANFLKFRCLWFHALTYGSSILFIKSLLLWVFVSTMLFSYYDSAA
jgi:hypothetical protein